MTEAVLQERHFIVTGGGRGIGAVCASELALMGAEVTLVARTKRDLEETADAIVSSGGRARIRVADVTDADQVSDVVAEADAHSPLWGSVNSVGGNRTGPTVTYQVEDFDDLVALNLRSTFLMCQAVGRRLIARGHGGRLINISSQMGSVGYPGRAAYCAVKHAVDGLTEALAVEWASENITVNAVAPTFIETAMTSAMLAEDAFREDVLRRIPLGRLGTLDEVAAAVGFLASPRASLVTGHVLLVDGGWTAW